MRSFFTDAKYSALRHAGVTLLAVMGVAGLQWLSGQDFGEWNILLLPLAAWGLRTLTPIAK